MSTPPSEPYEPSDREGPWMSSLFPSQRQELARSERELSRELEATLAGAPGIERVRVHLALPSPSPLVGVAQPTPAKALVVLQYHTASPWETTEVKQLVSSAVQGLAPQHVTVIQKQLPVATPPTSTPAQSWITVGPLKVASESAGLLRAVLGGLCVLGLGLVAIAVTLWLRLRALLATERSLASSSEGAPQTTLRTGGSVVGAHASRVGAAPPP